MGDYKFKLFINLNLLKNLMIEKKDKRILLSNFKSLSLLQVANYILPLITVPYLIRVIGIEKFGLLAFVAALILFFQNIIEYGFNLTATKDISCNQNNLHELNKIVNSVIQAKIILFIISFFILSLIVFSFEKFRIDWYLYYFTFMIALGELLFPIWFFQGVEKMNYIVKLTIISRILYSISIFLFINDIEDYIYVPILNSLSFILLGLMSIYVLHKDFSIRFKLQSTEEIIKVIKDGYHIFLSKTTVYLYTSANILLLGFFYNHQIVGYYSIVEQIMNVLLRIPQVINQTIYPYLAKLKNKKDVNFDNNINLFLFIIIFLMIIFAFLTFLFSEKIVLIVSGERIIESIKLLNILIFTLILIPLGGFFTQYFVMINQSKVVTTVTFYTVIFNFLVFFPFIYFFDFYGIGYTVVCTQIFQVIINFILKNKGSNFVK